MRKMSFICVLVCLLVFICSLGVSAKFLELWVGSLSQVLARDAAGLEAQINFHVWALRNGYLVTDFGLVGGTETNFTVNSGKTSANKGTLDIDSADQIDVKWVQDYNPENIGFMTIVQGFPITIHQDSTPEEYYNNIKNVLSMVTTGSPEYLTQMTAVIFCDTDAFVPTSTTTLP